MTVFKVGFDDSTRGLFGHKRTTVEFDEALREARVGDIITIQAGYTVSPSEKIRVINKSIKLVGEGGENNPSVISNGVVISGDVNVEIDNVFFSGQTDKNIISLIKGATVKCHNVVISNQYKGMLRYATIGVSEKCTLFLTECHISGGVSAVDPSQSYLYVDKGKIEIDNSDIEERIVAVGGEVNIKNSDITYTLSNALVAKEKSKISVKDSKIIGGYKDEKSEYACVDIENSEFNITASSIIQPEFYAALFVHDSAMGDCIGLVASSVMLSTDADVSMYGNCRIWQSISVQEKSSVFGDQIIVDGVDTNLVSLFVTDESLVDVNWIGFGKLKDPVVRMDKTAMLQADLHMLDYDEINRVYTITENSFTDAKNSKVNISYIGDDEEVNKKNSSEDELDGQNDDEVIEEKGEGDILEERKENLTQSLDEMIGLKNVKSQVKEFVAVAAINKKREEKGLTSSSQTLHSIFAGNPGTGKTTVARLLGKLLYEKGVIEKNILIEASRSDLVAQYIGQTAVKTRKVLKSALGGILFIDEAYTLTPDSQNDFGGEAIDEILKFMEDHRSEIMIIFAGYSKEMEKFLATNPGLKSRIPNIFEFEDYTSDELVELGLLNLQKNGYILDKNEYSKKLKELYSISNDHSNGRWVRNFNESICRKQAIRLSSGEEIVDDEEALSTITLADIKNVKL